MSMARASDTAFAPGNLSPVTITDDLYCKIGRMTVEFGNLDFMVGLVAERMAQRLRDTAPVPKFTQQRLRAIKDLSKAHAGIIGDELSAQLVQFANDAAAVLRNRPDGAHGMWLQEADAAGAYAMKLDPGETMGVRSSTDLSTVERLTKEAIELNLRLGPLAVRFLKLFER